MTIPRNRRVFVVLGLYRPDPALLALQLQSLVSQTHRHIEVLVCPDGPHDVEVAAAIAGFSGFPVHVFGSDARVGVHANFARGLRHALTASRNVDDLFAFCDQDDVWRPAKLERQVACLADASVSLCHCDARIVSDQGDVLAPSLFEHEMRPRSATFLDLLVMNSVTGMTAVFKRDVAEAAEPFPLAASRHVLHDHWTALVASLLGSIRFIDEPLLDYRQHAGNVMGARRWRDRPPRRGAPSSRRAYLLKCYREFLWRRHALEGLRRRLGHVPGAAARLSAAPVRAIFDCGAARPAGLALSLAYRLKGQRRQADQLWRIWRGKLLYCSSLGAT